MINMRYCVNCGKELKNERFCTGCGTDNGVPEVNTPPVTPGGGAGTTPGGYRVPGGAGVPGRIGVPTIDIGTILHWITIALFVVTAIIQLSTCLKNENNITSYSMMYTGGIVLSCIYFVIGMWSIVPAVSFILNVKTNKSETAAGAALVMLILMIVMAIFRAIAKKVSVLSGFVLILNPYVNGIAKTIVFCVLTIGVCIAQKYLAATGRR